MTAPAWFSDLSSTLVAGVAPSAAVAAQAQLNTMSGQLASLSSAQVDQVRRTFSSNLVGRIMTAAVPTDPANGGAFLAPVQAAVGQARTALTAPLAALNQLLAAAQPLRDAADAAWRVAAAAGAAARTLERAEDIAAIAAMATGLPPVDAAWAAAAHAVKAALTVAEAATNAAKAADLAWGAVMHAVDSIRRAVFSALDAVSRVANDGVRALVSMAGMARTDAYGAALTDLQGAVSTVLGGALMAALSDYLGLDGAAGGVIAGDAHLLQSLRDLITTPIGSRVMRRTYGSRVPALQDAPMTPGLVAEIVSSVAEAIDAWEPRVVLRRVLVSTLAAGAFTLDLVVTLAGRTVTLERVL